MRTVLNLRIIVSHKSAHCLLRTVNVESCMDRTGETSFASAFQCSGPGVPGYKKLFFCLWDRNFSRPSHEFLSIPWRSELLLVHPPSIAALRHWQADRRGLGHLARLGLKEESCGFAKQETSCLADVSHGAFRLHFSKSYFSKHPSKYAPTGQYSGDISSLEIGFWEASSDSHREEKARLEKYPLHVRSTCDHKC